jgi:integrase
MKRAARQEVGSVVFDRRRQTWNYLQWVDGKRRSKLIGSITEYPTREAARDGFKNRALQEALSLESETIPEADQIAFALQVDVLVEGYKKERMPTRIDTRRSYEVWLNNHIQPRWGRSSITDLQARPVELWLRTLRLSPKSKVHIRGLIKVLWDFAMWSEKVPRQPNPMKLVIIQGASKRRKRPRSLTVEEFRRFAVNLQEPFRTLAVLSVCFGFRISECLALRWSDVDWLSSTLRIERSIVAQNVDEPKTGESRRELPMDESLLDLLKAWRQATRFSSSEDWVFASPIQLGRLPWSYDQIWRVYQKAAGAAGIGKMGTHSLRHTYRSLLDAVGTGLGVQQKLMRHADIRTTMNTYGDVVTDEMREAHGKVVKLAFPAQRIAADRKIC